MTCVDEETKCTSCDSSLLRHLGDTSTGDANECTCDDGYFDNGVDDLCECICSFHINHFNRMSILVCQMCKLQRLLHGV